MNSLNILSAHVTTPAKPLSDRPRLLPETTHCEEYEEPDAVSEIFGHKNISASQQAVEGDEKGIIGRAQRLEPSSDQSNASQEKSVYNDESRRSLGPSIFHGGAQVTFRKLLDALFTSLKWIFSTLSAPGLFLFANLKAKRKTVYTTSKRRKSTEPDTDDTRRHVSTRGSGLSGLSARLGKRVSDSTNAESAPFTDPMYASSDSDSELLQTQNSSQPRHVSNSGRSMRSKSANGATTQRSRQIQGNGKTSPDARNLMAMDDAATQLAVAALKSPTSPGGGLRSRSLQNGPAPPRPLIPKRQPSFAAQGFRHQLYSQKILVIDLDETLIHSLAKGGRMSSGHMVEVKLNTTIGLGGATLGPQHPILYYVHKRPHCDDFLRKVCKWYKLVVFTASVQEYADPVIDWLEQERKFFAERYYRQHCTYRQGAYIKDLSSIDSDLSRIMILDNSPLSYSFHEDNAIPIEGWINDPTDNDLLHLVPMLEALQYVEDVRMLLSLRKGESDYDQ